MKKALALLRGEPALVAAVLNGGIALAASFGLNLSPEQVGVLFTVVSLALGVSVRQRVSPTS